MGARHTNLKVDFKQHCTHALAMLSALIPFPNIGPDIFSVEIAGFTLALRWYAVAYIAGIILGWRIIVRALNAPRLWRNETAPMTPTQMEDLLTWIIIGIIAGGRLGFVIFYQPAHFLANPGQIPQVWQGGMSFHGGFIGVILAVFFYSRRHGLPTASIADALAFATPLGLMLGRIANFINAELWGRPTDLPWAVAFPGIQAQHCPDIPGICGRHPSQLYEAGLEGLLLGLLLLFLVWRRDWLKIPGQITGLFFIGYGLSRFLVEFVRQADTQFISPDNPMGYVIGVASFGLSMGQLLSLPMILIGLLTLNWARRRA